MDRKDAFDGLQFHDDLVVHQQVDPIAAVDPKPSIVDRQRLLSLDLELAPDELADEARLVRRFQQTRTELDELRSPPL